MTEPEPGGWELMRSINALRDSVDKLAAGMVTQATLAIIQQAQKDKDDRQDARIKQLETDRDADRKAKTIEDADVRKAKAQQWFAIGLALLTGLIGLGGGLILNLVPGGG